MVEGYFRVAALLAIHSNQFDELGLDAQHFSDQLLQFFPVFMVHTFAEVNLPEDVVQPDIINSVPDAQLPHRFVDGVPHVSRSFSYATSSCCLLCFLHFLDVVIVLAHWVVPPKIYASHKEISFIIPCFLCKVKMIFL